MEKRVKKPRSLNRVLGWYLVRTLALCGLVLAAAWQLIMALMLAGLLLPAYTMSNVAEEAAAAQAGLPSLDPETLPDAYCRWALFADKNAGAPVLATNMDDRHLRAAQNAQRGGSGNVGYSQFHRQVQYADGTVLFLQFDYAVHYADPALDAALPDLQVTYAVFVLAMLVATVIFSTRRTARALCAEAAKLTAAGEKIAAGQLPPPGRADVREFDAALTAMQTLGRTMTDSLQKQWAMEQQRAEQMAALAHDLKTPLAIMQGNAELLAEEPLTGAQKAQVEAILRGAGRAQSCLQALRAAAEPPEPRTPVNARDFAAGLAATGLALCRPAGVEFALENELDGSFTARPAELTRALENLLDNAVRHTPPGGTVRLRCARRGGEVRFTVTDTGPGFTPEALRKAGQFLYTEDAARSGGAHQGLGLYLAGAAARAHGGALTLCNTADGAEVTLTLAEPQ